MARSSVGRASARHAEGRRFESGRANHFVSGGLGMVDLLQETNRKLTKALDLLDYSFKKIQKLAG